MVTADVDVRRRSPRAAVALLLAAMALMSPSAVSAQAVLPDVIALPPGWQPEGIAKGGGTTMFSASIASLGNRLYLINSRFSTPPAPTTPYAMVAPQRR